MSKKGTGRRTGQDEQVELLRGIWTAIKELGQNLGSRIDQTNARLDKVREDLSDRIDQTNARLDETNTRLDATRSDLVQRITESEVRTATAIAELAGTMRDVRDLLRGQLDLRDRVARCEHDIQDIRSQIGART